MYQLLIVDDQPDLVDDLAEMLPWSSVGIETVHRAYSAPEALEIVMTHPIDVIITDIRMPGMSGLDLIERIRASWKKIRCILLSGHEDFEYAKRAMQYQATDYLLKPADDKELLNAVGKAVREVEQQWEEVSSYQNALYSVKKNLPVLRNHLLQSLLDGRHNEDLPGKLNMLEIPFNEHMPVCVMLLRLEEYFDQYVETDMSLMEYAVGNITEEIFRDDFRLWQTKDNYGYLVFLLQQNQETPSDVNRKEQVEMKAAQLQHYVKLYLKGTISVLVSGWGSFSDDVHQLYEQSVANFRQHIGGEREFLLSIGGESDQSQDITAYSLKHLYEPPLLVNLLEAGQWSALDDKLEAVFNELEEKWGHSHEHILETYFTIVSAFSFSIHKSRRWMSEILGEEFNKLGNTNQFHTIHQLREWTARIVNKFKEIMANETQDTRSNLVRQVQEYVHSNLKDASLQVLASHVSMNPSYLSKIYKMETGEGISEFLSRLKMEQAIHKLRNSNEKIYEIASALGYVKTSYFIKVFKEKFGMTPQEYRDKMST